jgi:hypothetical protein
MSDVIRSVARELGARGFYNVRLKTLVSVSKDDDEPFIYWLLNSLHLVLCVGCDSQHAGLGNSMGHILFSVRPLTC